MTNPKFETGQIVATPGCMETIEEAGQTPHELLIRHLAGDWGNVDAEDAGRNDAALLEGSRLLSAYVLKSGTTIWIITEATDDDGRRASTCLLLPDEY